MRETSRTGVTQRRHATPLRFRVTFPCYVVLCYDFLGGVVAGACASGIRPTATISAADSAGQVMQNMSPYVPTAGMQREYGSDASATLNYAARTRARRQ